MASQHSAEFRQEALSVALTIGLDRKQVAADFDVGFSTLSRWIHLECRDQTEPTIHNDHPATLS